MKRLVACCFGLLACFLTAACSYKRVDEQKDARAGDAGETLAAPLIAAVKSLSAEGFPENHYDLAPLEAAVASGDRALIRAHAEALFDTAAADMSGGVAPQQTRLEWRMESPARDAETLARLKEETFDNADFAAAFASLAPKHEQYAFLKAALNVGGHNTNERARLRLNMDRWRWMPDDLGKDYLLVNVPAFELILVRDGDIIDRRRVVTGTTRLPTPQFKALVTGVVFNPTWFVPASIVRESVGALMKNDPARAAQLGYYTGADGNVRQKPGPANALGQMKLAMPNPFSVFLHDTPAKELFNRENRALSHGCIRVEDALGFARTILGEAITDEAFKDIVAKGKTVEITLARPLPVYVGYFTAVAQPDGAVKFYPDIYGRDTPLITQFGGEETGDRDVIKTLIEESCPESAGEAALPDKL